MPKKTQSVSRSARRDAGIESRSNGNGITIHARISERAYALYEEHGRKEGHAL